MHTGCWRPPQSSTGLGEDPGEGTSPCTMPHRRKGGCPEEVMAKLQPEERLSVLHGGRAGAPGAEETLRVKTHRMEEWGRAGELWEAARDGTDGTEGVWQTVRIEAGQGQRKCSAFKARVMSALFSLIAMENQWRFQQGTNTVQCDCLKYGKKTGKTRRAAHEEAVGILQEQEDGSLKQKWLECSESDAFAGYLSFRSLTDSNCLHCQHCAGCWEFRNE